MAVQCRPGPLAFRPANPKAAEGSKRIALSIIAILNSCYGRVLTVRETYSDNNIPLAGAEVGAHPAINADDA